MAKLSIFFLLCSLSMVLGNYYYYPNAPAVAGALSYPYVSYGYAAPYAVVAAQQPDCDKKEKGGESSSSESSSEESSSSESSEEGEKKEEKEEGEEGESTEGGEEKEEGEEKKEGEEKEESSSSSSSSSSEESKEGEGEKKEEKKEGKEENYLFPPRTYSFPPVQQVVYSQPTYSYGLPYKTYSIVQSAPVSYPVKSAYVAAPYAAPVKSAYVAAPYAAPVKSYAASPVTRIISTAPATARIVSVPAAKSYSAYSSYINPASGVLGMPSYLGNNLAYYKA